MLEMKYIRVKLERLFCELLFQKLFGHL